jgi:1-deoxy-D-xylulose-5-phosphate reductoisomerase
MKVPIAYALAYPDRLPLNGQQFEPPGLGPLTFEEPDMERFPCLGLAFRAARVAGTMPTVLNAANEIAVELFLARKIPFTAIPKIIEAAMDEHRVTNVSADLEEILESDGWARQRALELAREQAL